MEKKIKNIICMMAIAIASMTMTACSSDDETEKSFTICPVEQTKFFVCESSGETRGATAALDTIFTEDDIEWFDVSTREIKFFDKQSGRAERKDMNEQLFKKLMENYHKEGLEFHLGDNVLFEVSRFVADIDSRIFYDLVLHYSAIGEDADNPRYYLHDCYPPQFINDEQVQANRAKRADQWKTFIRYLASKGKLKK